jgi:putative transposase
VQNICQRIEKAYQLFFKHYKKGIRPPGFKKVRRYKSFSLKQAGYKFLGGNRSKIGSKVYQYWKSYRVEDTVKTLTIKRTPLLLTVYGIALLSLWEEYNQAEPLKPRLHL